MSVKYQGASRASSAAIHERPSLRRGIPGGAGVGAPGAEATLGGTAAAGVRGRRRSLSGPTLRWVPRGGEMRIIAFVTEHTVVTRILAHLARRGVDAHARPRAGAAAG